MKNRLTFPLRATLVTSVVTATAIVLAIGILAVGMPAYSNATKTIRSLWKDLSEEMANTATIRVLSYFQSGPRTLKFITGLVEENQLNITDQETIFDTCYRALKENSNFLNVYFAKTDGTFYGVFLIGNEYIASLRTVGADGKTKVQNFKIAPGNIWKPFEETTNDYDPRKRPFWTTGTENPDGGWTEPYVFATTGAKGYSYVLPQNEANKRVGYWAVDFQIDLLAQYLQSLKLGREGIVYIVANDGKVIAQSTPDTKLEEKPWVQATGFTMVKDRIFYANPFPKESQIPWYLITSIHEDDYLNPIRSYVFSTLKIGLIPCALFILIAMIFFGRISRRLIEISWDMDAAGNLSFPTSKKDRLISRIREVNVMNHALDKMKIGLASFSKYAPVDLIKKLIRSGQSARLGGEKKEVTVFFADLDQFTTFAEKMDTDQISDVLGTFLTAASTEVHKESGTIDKFMGDAVMALWGAPEPVPNPELAACRAALALQKAAAKNPRIKHRIGINTGDAMVGNFGSQERMDFTAIGDIVNVGSRLEKLNKRYETKILIGVATAEAVQQQLLVRPLDWVLLEGRAHPTLVYELIGDKKEASKSTLEGVAVYTSALQAFKDKDLRKALELFDRANQLLGGSDTPSKLLVDRCRAGQ